MAGFDFSYVSDSELEAVMDDLLNDPMARFATPVAQRQAVVAEYNRRRAKPAAKPATNVERDLDAAATPIAPDPAVSPKDAYRQSLGDAGWSPERVDLIMKSEAGMPGAFEEPVDPDAERRAVGYVGGRDNREAAFDASLAAAYGHNAPPPMGTTFTRNNDGSAYSPMTDFGGGASATVDGVKVRTFDLGDGQQRYRLGDVKRAQEAEHEAKLAAMFSQSAQEDLAKYGTRQLMKYTYDDGGQITGVDRVEPSLLSDEEQEQQDNLMQRKLMEARQYRQNRALRNRPGLQQFEAEADARRKLRSDMARLAGGSSGLRGGPGGNMGMFQALAMLEGVDPHSMDARQRNLQYASIGGPLAAGVDAQNVAQAGRIAQNAMIAFMQANPQFGQNPLMMHQLKRLENLRLVAGEAFNSGWDKLAAVTEALIGAGASATERARILAEIFGAAAGAASQGAPPAAAPSQSQFFPGQEPPPPPRNPMAAPRPFG